MDYNENQFKIYKDLVSTFCKNTYNLYNSMWNEKIDYDLSGLFIPHVLNEYGKTQKKVFYIGQDTYEWTDLEDVYIKWQQNNLSEYFERNNNWPKNLSDILEYKSRSNNFWETICRIQLAIHNLDYSISLDSVDKKTNKILSSIGWGNLFSLEVIETVKKYKYNDKPLTEYFDLTKYKAIQKEAESISKLKNILDAYDPDLIIIMSWNNYAEEFFFDGIDYTWNEEQFIDGLISTYSINNSNKKVIWCNHPNRLRYKKLNIETGLIKPILSVLNKAQQWE